MNDLNIDRTKRLPGIHFSHSGNLKIEGRSYSENPVVFYMPIIEWCKNLKAESVKLNINIEIMNTVSNRCIYEIVKVIDKNSCVNSFCVNWYYDKDDDRMLNLGQIIEESCSKSEFTFLPIDELEDEEIFLN